MINALYILGAIASILGAIYAWRQAANAKKYAERAGKQVAEHRRTSDLSHLKALWKSTYEVLANFGPCARAIDLRGKNAAEPARKAQDYLTAVMSRKSSLEAIDDLDNRLTKLTELLNKFSSARSTDDMKSSGTTLLNELCDLDAAVRSALNKEREVMDLS